MRRMNAFAGGSDSSGGWFEGVGDEVVVLFVTAMALLSTSMWMLRGSATVTAEAETESETHRAPPRPAPSVFANANDDSSGHRLAPEPARADGDLGVTIRFSDDHGDMVFWRQPASTVDELRDQCLSRLRNVHSEQGLRFIRMGSELRDGRATLQQVSGGTDTMLLQGVVFSRAERDSAATGRGGPGLTGVRDEEFPFPAGAILTVFCGISLAAGWFCLITRGHELISGVSLCFLIIFSTLFLMAVRISI